MRKLRWGGLRNPPRYRVGLRLVARQPYFSQRFQEDKIFLSVSWWCQNAVQTNASQSYDTI